MPKSLAYQSMICHQKSIAFAGICQYAAFSGYVCVYSLKAERKSERTLFSLSLIYFIIDILGINDILHTFFGGISAAYHWHTRHNSTQRRCGHE